MSPITFSKQKYLILHGHSQAGVTLLVYEPPSKVHTGHPNVEDFDDAQEAIDRAIELGIAPLLTEEFWPRDKSFNLATRQLVDLQIENFDSSKKYSFGDVVRYELKEEVEGEEISSEVLFLKISDAHPSIPDLVYDLEAGTGDWVIFNEKPEPAPPTLEQKMQQLEEKIAALIGE